VNRPFRCTEPGGRFPPPGLRHGESRKFVQPAAIVGSGFGDGDEVAVDTPGFMLVVPDLLAVFIEELICFFSGHPWPE